jgi:predicted dehydrogenase
MNKVGVGTVGFGSIAEVHLQAMLSNGINTKHPIAYPRALCTTHPEKNHGLPYEIITGSVKDLIEDDMVRIVDICTPNDRHFETAKAVIEAGKGIYLEKPLTNQLEDSTELCRLVEQSGCVNQAALVMRFFPSINRVKDLLEDGKIGEIIHFKMNFYHSSYMDPLRITSWRQQLVHAGGGACLDLGIHHVDIMRYLLGDAKRVMARMITMNKERYVDASREKVILNDTDEYMTATIELESGAIGCVEASRISKSGNQNESFEIFGTKGSIYADLSGTPNKIYLYDAMSNEYRRIDHGEGKHERDLARCYPAGKVPVEKFVGAHRAAIQNLVEWACGEKPFLGTPIFKDAYEAQKIITACQTSDKQMQWVELS